MAIWPSAVATDADLYVAKNSLQTTLATAVNASVTTIVLASSTGWPTAGAAVIGNEVIFYTGVSGASLTGCTRGADGTTAATHTVGVPVGAAIVAFHHNGLKDEIEAIESYLDTVLGKGTSTTATEFGYLHGVTSAIQTQLNLKATLASPTFTGVAAFAAGSVSAPSINFGTANSGIYGTFSTHISFAVNGVQTLDLQPSSVTVPTGVQLNLPDGSVSAPSLTFSTGSQNTGIYVTGAGASMRFSSAGSNKLSVVSSGVEVTTGNLSFVSTSTQGILGTTTNNDAAAGNVGEAIRSSVTTPQSSTGSGQFFDITSITLTAGDWDISGQVIFNLNGAVQTVALAAITSTSGNSVTGQVDGDNRLPTTVPVTACDTHVTIASYRVTLTGSTVYYLKSRCDFSSGTPKAYGRISARRVR